MNEIQYHQAFCAWMEEHARRPLERRFSTAEIDDPVEEIETMGRGEPREPLSLPRTLRADLLKSQFRPAKCSRPLRAMMEDKRVNARGRRARKSRFRPQPDHGVAHAHRPAVIDPEMKTGLSLKTFRSSSAWSVDQLISYDLRSTDA
jgi:hypothetical protein